MPRNLQLRVWWVPQVPGNPIHFQADSIEEARKILDVLGDYDLFLEKQKIRGDFANAGGIEYCDPDLNPENANSWHELDECELESF